MDRWSGLRCKACRLAHGISLPACSGRISLARSFAAYTALRAEIVAFDARRLGLTFAVPMFFLQGADDLFTVTAEVAAYAAEIAAPHVELVRIDGSGHSTLFLRNEFLALLVSHVRPKLLDS